jgi:hypothetical protein
MKYHIAIVIGNISLGNTYSEVKEILEGIGFSDIIQIAENQVPNIKNMLTGFFEHPSSSFALLEVISTKFRKELDENYIGACEYFLIDITNTSFKYGRWHDGFY